MIKQPLKGILTPSILLLLILFIPRHGTGQSKYDSVKVFPDSVIYVFNTDRVARADDQRTIPLHFKLKLPPGMLSTYAAGMQSFGFLYKQKQVVYVYLDDHMQSAADTAYRVTGADEMEMEDLLLDKLNGINYNTKLDIDRNPYRKDRESWIYKKGKATILLYNIRKAEYERFRTIFFTFLSD